MKKITILLLFLLLFPTKSFSVQKFTQEDRERLVRLEAILKVFMKQVDKRFEQIDKRFEQVDKRISELRMDMNKRFDQMMSFFWILSGIFTTLTVTVIGFAYWDRRTIIRRAKEEAIEEIEKEGRLRDLIRALKKLSEEDRRLAEVLKEFRIL